MRSSHAGGLAFEGASRSAASPSAAVPSRRRRAPVTFLRAHLRQILDKTRTSRQTSVSLVLVDPLSSRPDITDARGDAPLSAVRARQSSMIASRESGPEGGVIADLTRRQRHLAVLIAAGCSNAEIAKRLRISGADCQEPSHDHLPEDRGAQSPAIGRLRSRATSKGAAVNASTFWPFALAAGPGIIWSSNEIVISET